MSKLGPYCANYLYMSASVIKTRHALKIFTVFSAFFGVILSLITARAEGYFVWYKRLFYFTAQSNIWIGATYTALLFKDKLSQNAKKRLYLLRYVFTVSITVTSLIFCGLLAPFSDDSYTPWTIPNVFTHIVTPLLAVTDFFLDNDEYIYKKQVPLALLPPLFYLIFVSVLQLFSIDFGRGVPYPYFFTYYHSPAGVFGFSTQRPFFLGSFYWIAFFLIFVLALGYLYAYVNNKKTSRTRV